MKLPQFMQKVSKRVYAAIAIATATVVVPATLFAWGPSTRVLFTEANPATYVTFNSIKDNKLYGNETDFVQVRNLTDNTAFSNDTTLIPGKEYEVFTYYHNNANANLNASGVGVAKGTFMRTQMESTIKAGGEARITSFVGATNAKHLDKDGKDLGNQVWDEAYGKNTTNGDITLSFVAGSAKITNKGATNGKTLPDTLWSTGTALGYNALDGVLPGCENYSGYVTYRFKVNQPNFTVEKTVSKSGANSYSENVTTDAGATVDFKIKYLNTGTTTQTVTIRDQLPAGLEYINGSTYFANTNTGGKWIAAGYDTVTKQGLGVGQYLPGGAVYVKFSAKVSPVDKMACGKNTFTNIANADTENGSKSDTATVEVNKDCQPPKKVTACNLDTKKIEQVEESKIDDIHFTLDLDKCKPVEKTIEVCRLSDKKYPVTIKESEFDSTKYSKDPNDCKEEEKTITVCRLSDKAYPVTIKESEFDSSKYSMNPNDCKEVEDKEITVCRLSDKVYPVVIKESEFDSSKYSKDPADCAAEEKTIEVCRLSDKTYPVTIKESEFDSTKYSKDPADCATVETTIEVCRLSDKTYPVTIKESEFDSTKYSKDADDCKEEETPVELPHTGMGETFLNVLGAGSLVSAAGAYTASRRK